MASDMRDKFAALAGVLRQQHAALGWLAFKVSQAELLTEAAEARFLPMMIDELDEVADEVGTIEIARALIVDELCEGLGYPDDAKSLAELIEEAPADLKGVLTKLRADLVELVSGLHQAAARGGAAAKQNLGIVHTVLAKIEPAAPSHSGYDQWGAAPVPVAGGASRFDTAL